MNKEIVENAVALAQKIKHVFVATASDDGLPHIAAAAKMTLISNEENIAVEAWYCPTTLINLKQNPLISLIIWDPKTDEGYQLLGETVKVEDLAMMNGYDPKLDLKTTLPQVERRLVVRVKDVLIFTHAPHTDVKEL
jgi:hypothetical protein